MELLYRQLFGS